MIIQCLTLLGDTVKTLRLFLIFPWIDCSTDHQGSLTYTPAGKIQKQRNNERTIILNTWLVNITFTGLGGQPLSPSLTGSYFSDDCQKHAPPIWHVFVCRGFIGRIASTIRVSASALIFNRISAGTVRDQLWLLRRQNQMTSLHFAVTTQIYNLCWRLIFYECGFICM